ncbi:MAG: metal ABC transporter substrate-binding protein [Clostridia bacterium]|nr:metal ABC transporter substrate-binding protein [Clostridia bacterium]
MKRVLLLLMTVFLTACCPVRGEARLNIVTTTFPQYDWIVNIMGDEAENADITLLAKSGDMHSFQPSANDIIAISTCDMFVYVGGESDSWVNDVLKGARNPDMAAVSMLEIAGEGLIETSHEGHDHDEESHDHEERDEDHVYDEHVWLSLRMSQTICGELAEVLARLDPENASKYRENAQAYIEKLADLDERYIATVESSTKRTLLFADRFPFGYMTRDYGLEYCAAFEGCEAEAETSFETVAHLAKDLRELNLSAVLVIDGSNDDLASTVISSAGMEPGDVEILRLNSMQSANDQSKSYLSVMEDNLYVLQAALN